MKTNLKMFKNMSKICLFMLIVGSCVHFVLCKPIKNSSEEASETEYQPNEESTTSFKGIDENQINRAKRQVVQPTWLIDKQIPNPWIEQRVRVTDENLREAAAIRKAIQSAVDSDTFFVDPGQPSDSNNLPANKPAEATDQKHIQPKSPDSFFPMKFPAFPFDFSAFQRFFQPFNSHTGNVAETKGKDVVSAMAAESENKASNEFQKAWHEFMENAKKKWPSETAKFQPCVSSTRHVAETETEAAPAKSGKKPSNEFQKAWLDFMENSKQMVSSIPPAETVAENDFMEEFDNLWTEFEDNFMKIWSVDLF